MSYRVYPVIKIIDECTVLVNTYARFTYKLDVFMECSL